MLSKYNVFGIKEKNKNIVYYKEYARPHTLQELRQYNAAAAALIDHDYIAAYKDIETLKTNESGSALIAFKKIRPCLSGFIFD